MKNFKGMVLCFGVLGAILGGCQRSEPAKFPQQPITIICPPAPGGVSDLLTRTLAASAQRVIQSPIIVENKPGGANAIGLAYGARAKPDGYTVTYLVAELAILPHLKLSPLTIDSYEPLARTNFNPAVVTVNADSPWRTLEEFLKEARRQPDSIAVGNSGTGSIWHLSAASLQTAAGVQFKHVPYSGAAPAVQALLGKHIQAVCVSYTEVQSQVEAGTLRVLAVLDSQRDPLLPETPTATEEGYNVQIGAWGGLALPKNVPKPVLDTLMAAFRQAYQDPAFVQRMQERGVRLAWLEGEAFAGFVRKQSEQNQKIIAAIELNPTAHDVGASFFPTLLIGAIMVLGVGVVWQGIRAGTHAPPVEAIDHRSRAWGAVGLTLGYGILFGWLGFLISTALYLTGMARLMGQTSVLRAALFALMSVGVFWLLFVYLLRVPLP